MADTSTCRCASSIKALAPDSLFECDGPCRAFMVQGTGNKNRAISVVFSKQLCGGTFSCDNARCKSIGCSVTKKGWCGLYGEGGTCPNLCAMWADHQNKYGEGYGYTCMKWGRKKCKDEVCPSTKETAASAGLPAWTGTMPGPGTGPCSGKKCYNGFVLYPQICGCVCNPSIQKCPAGYTLKITGAVEPKKCQCVSASGTTVEPNPTSPPIGTPSPTPTPSPLPFPIPEIPGVPQELIMGLGAGAVLALLLFLLRS